MKRVRILFLLIVTVILNNFLVYSQTGRKIEPGSPLYVEIYKLDNGLTVYLNEDHNQPNVFGAVVVKGGAKCDPPGHPGVAHYFEHIMFKGTDKLGTINYLAEKTYLDSIKVLYDKLGATKDKLFRQTLQQKINELSVKAAEYAIPNEVDKIVDKMGGAGLNAFTSKECIVYHNSFPSGQIDKWMELYSHRFVHPVYRLFQSELETVYEEKNMAMDNPMYMMFELFERKFYKVHPYGNSVIGEVENLKNPSLTKMDEFFQTWYVANNMALVISGDFNPSEIKPVIREKFGVWKSGNVPARTEYREEGFKGREEIKKRMTPIKIGIIGYRTVPNGHADEVALQVCNSLLSNESGTGLFDKLSLDNKLMGAGSFSNNYNDYGGTMIFFIPKVVGQSFSKAEKLLFAEIEKIKKGDFTDDQLEAIKTELYRQFESGLENNQSRSYSILFSFVENRSWEDAMNFPEKVKKLTRQDIMNVANKYFGDNYLVLESKTGFPKKHKLEKPPYKPVDPKNSEFKSEFARKIENMPAKPVDPRYIEFGPLQTSSRSDVYYSDISGLSHFYYTTNPINDIFSLEIKFGAGSEKIPLLKQAASYYNLIGTESQTVDEFKKSLQKIGSTLSVYSSDSYVTISINGLDMNFNKTLVLLNELLTKPKTDDSKIARLAEEAKTNVKYEQKDPRTIADALSQYALYGNKSEYIDRYRIKEIKAMKSDSLVAAMNKAMKYEVNIHYVGKIEASKVVDAIKKEIPLIMASIVKSNSPVYKQRNLFSGNTIMFVNDKKAVQSQINLNIEGNTNSREERAVAYAFNKYFGSDMSSLVFQEVREFRSLAYGAYAAYSPAFYSDKPGRTTGWLSTQADKTIEALQVMNDLFRNMPQKKDRLDIIKSALLQSINSERPTFREMSGSVESWRKQGYTDDPRKIFVKTWASLQFDDILVFYNSFINNKPILTTIVGDKSRIKMKDMSQFGNLTEVKKDILFRK